MNAGTAIEGKPRHRAQPGRFLRRVKWKSLNILGRLTANLLAGENTHGRFILILDSTMVGHQSRQMENTFSTGSRPRRPAKGRRYTKYKYAAKRCHCFVFGLLLTPAGTRVPFYKPYYERTYAQQKHLSFRTQAQLAAQIIDELPLPRDVRVIVLGDTAFDSKEIRKSCDQRDYIWIVPCNANRVFAGPRKKRQRVTSQISQLSKERFQDIRIAQGSGPYARQRRLSAHRVGSKLKPRTYYVHTEEREVHSVGLVTLVFSSTKPIKEHANRDSTKLLLTNAIGWDSRRIVELYMMRWQIELFFKELKSELGMHQYKYRQFSAVTGWIELVLITFVFLEWTRKRKLSDKRLTAGNRQIWQRQRTYGCRLAIIAGTRIRQRKWIAQRLKTTFGIARLKRMFTKSLAYEYQCIA